MKVELGDLPHNSEPRLEFIRVDDWDTYNLDNTFALLAVPLLKAFKGKKNGVPGKYMKLDMSKEEELHAASLWEAELDKMIWAFEFALTDDYFAMKMAQGGENFRKFREGLQSFIDNFELLWW
jgi:hypothetical protein